MNQTLQNPPASREATPAPIRRPETPPRGFRWNWLALVCVLVGLSGGVRYWRDRQFQSMSQESEKPPFALAEFPKELGDWRVVEGSEVNLEPEIARIAGSSDSLIRTYTNAVTGESVSVMLIYGLAYQVWPHTPRVCYPAAGFRPVANAGGLITIRVPDRPEGSPFRKQKYAKGLAGNQVVQEVYYSFRNAGQWTPDVESKWKAFRYHPGMFKIQVQRASRDSGDDETGAEQLIGRIVQEIERRLEKKG